MGVSRASSSVKMQGSGTDFVGHLWLLWPAANPGVLHSASCSKPAAGRDERGGLIPHFGRYVPWQSEKWGVSRASSSVKMQGSGTDFVGNLWLLWPAANPGVLHSASCSKPAAGRDERGGGHSSHILVGTHMCRGKVKNGGLQSEL